MGQTKLIGDEVPPLLVPNPLYVMDALSVVVDPWHALPLTTE
jgi:hypothetical protein